MTLKVDSLGLLDVEPITISSGSIAITANNSIYEVSAESGVSDVLTDINISNNSDLLGVAGSYSLWFAIKPAPGHSIEIQSGGNIITSGTYTIGDGEVVMAIHDRTNALIVRTHPSPALLTKTTKMSYMGTIIDSGELLTDSPTIDIASGLSGYDKIEIEISSKNTSTTAQLLYMLFNNDTTLTNYYYWIGSSGYTSANYTLGTGGNGTPRIGTVGRSNAYWDDARITIYNPDEVAEHGAFSIEASPRSITGPEGYVNITSLMWKPATYAAINRITLKPAANSFLAGTTYKVVGYKEEQVISDVTGTAIAIPVSSDVGPGTFNAVLSLSPTDPFPTGDIVSDTLYLHPANGKNISIYDGSVWRGYTLDQPLQLLVSSIGGSGVYDIYVWDNGDGIPRLLSDSSDGKIRFDGVVTNGLYSLRYVGTIKKNSLNLFEDSAERRLLWNYYNQREKLLRKYYTTSNLALNTGSIWASVPDDPRPEFVLGFPSNVELEANLYISMGASISARLGVTLNGNNPGLDDYVNNLGASAISGARTILNTKLVPYGHHQISGRVWTSGSVTFYMNESLYSMNHFVGGKIWC